MNWRFWERPPQPEVMTSESVVPLGEPTRKAVSVLATPAPVSMPWDTGIRTGQGEAGDYIAHLRSLKRSKPGTRSHTIAEAGLLPLRFATKEEPMKLNIVIEANTFGSAAQLILNPPDGIKILAATEYDPGSTPVVTETHENSPLLEGRVLVRLVGTADIADYLDTLVGTPSRVMVAYKGENDLSARLRHVSISSRAYHAHNTAWTVYDHGIGEPRTFLLRNIKSVDGPAR
jgi:hypothetical protein